MHLGNLCQKVAKCVTMCIAHYAATAVCWLETSGRILGSAYLRMLCMYVLPGLSTHPRRSLGFFARSSNLGEDFMCV